MGLFSRDSATFAVIGLGRFGTAVARTLASYDQDVILIDKDAEKIRELREISDYAYIMKRFDLKSFEEVGMRDVDTAIVCIGENLEANLLAVLYCQQLEVKNIIAKANSIDQGVILKKMGVEVVYPEWTGGKNLAQKLLNQEITDYFSITSNLDLAQIPIPPNFVGKRLIELRLRQKWGINVIAIKSGDKTTEEIDPGYVFRQGDIIIVIGSLENIRRFEDDMADS